LRISPAVLAVLEIFIQDVTKSWYGYDLMKATKQASGKLYPILTKLVAAGWLVRDWSDIDPTVEGRPARRWYRLTPDGIPAARLQVAHHRAANATAGEGTTRTAAARGEGCQVRVRAVTRDDGFLAGWLSWWPEPWHS
jgi:PadR family transcriptional regulator PadR